MRTIRIVFLITTFLMISNAMMAKTSSIQNEFDLENSATSSNDVAVSEPSKGNLENENKGSDTSGDINDNNSTPSSLILNKRSAQSEDGSWGIGIRLGDPSGITLKKYLHDGKALELSIGRTHFFQNDKYYDDEFGDWYSEQKYNYKKFDYVGFQSSTPIGIQLHYLSHKSLLDDDFDGLTWYWGLGAQARFQSFTYSYRYKLYNDKEEDWYYSTAETETNIDVGVDGCIGLEFTLPDVPVAIFLDATILMEIIDAPFMFWTQGGLGARYNF